MSTTVRDALWHKSQDSPRALSGVCTLERPQLSTSISLSALKWTPAFNKKQLAHTEATECSFQIPHSALFGLNHYWWADSALQGQRSNQYTTEWYSAWVYTMRWTILSINKVKFRRSLVRYYRCSFILATDFKTQIITNIFINILASNVKLNVNYIDGKGTYFK